MRSNLMAAAATAVLLMAGGAMAQDNDKHNGEGDRPAAAGDMSGPQDQDKTGGMRDQDKTGGMQNTDVDSGNNDQRNGRANDRMIQGPAKPGIETRNRDTNIRNHTTNITEMQKTRIREVVRNGPRLKHVTFRIGVGQRIPRNVRIVALPQEIVEIAPQWAGYSYFEYGEEIVVIDPVTFAIVGVLPL